MAVTSAMAYHPPGSLSHGSYFSQPYPLARPSSHDYHHSGRSSNYDSRRYTSPPVHAARPSMPAASRASAYESKGADTSFKLPSISNLLGIADSDPSSTSRNAHPEVRHSPLPSPHYTGNRPHSSSFPYRPSPSRYSPPQPAHASLNPSSISPKSTFSQPPSASRTLSVRDVINAESPRSTGSSAASPPLRVSSIINSVEPTERTSNPSSRDYAISSAHSSPSIGEAHYTTSPYATSPGASSTASYYPVSEASFNSAPSTTTSSHLFHSHHSHHLPHSSQSALAPTSAPSQTSGGAPETPSAYPCDNLWEHHHYISPTSQGVLPPSHNRYVCPTCNKAFSRPSSLKIHSHSHTGEKPFRCPHSGCEKSFSVRSNMKRHERGCHIGLGTSAASSPSLPLS